MNLHECLMIGAGGAAGAVARALVTVAGDRFGLSRLWATFTVNMIGSFCLGIVAAYLLRESSPGETLKPLVVIGFLGAFTTFSTLALELVGLARDGQMGWAIGYAFLTLAAGIGMVLVGQALIRP